MNLDATTTCAMAEPGTRASGLGTRDEPAQSNVQSLGPSPQTPVPCSRFTSSDSNAHNLLGCELAAEVIRSSGKLRLRATGASMLPSIWPGDVLTVSSEAVAETQPGDIILFEREGRLIAHRVVEVRRQESGDGSQDFGFKIQNSRFEIPNPLSRTPYSVSRIASPESRLEFVTCGDSVAGNDAPVLQHDVLGRVISVERGSRSFTPFQSSFSRAASWILSHSDFATRVLLKVGGFVMGIRKPGFRVVDSRPRIQDLA